MKHNLNDKKKTIKVGEIMMVKWEDKERRTWKTNRIDDLFVGKDGVIRGVWIKTPKGFLEQPV